MVSKETEMHLPVLMTQWLYICSYYICIWNIDYVLLCWLFIMKVWKQTVLKKPNELISNVQTS